MENENQRNATYDEDTDIFNLVNNKSRESAESERITSPSFSAEESRKSSVGKGPSVEQSNIKHKHGKLTVAQKVKKTLAVFGATILIATSLHGIADISIKVADKVKYHKDSTVAESILKENMTQKFIKCGLAAITKDNEFVILQNNIEDYIALGLSNTAEILSARNLINDDIEFEKFIQACYYYDEENKFCYYTSVDQFLRINGYTDKNTGAPSQKVWENYAENDAVEDYRNGTLTPQTASYETGRRI